MAPEVHNWKKGQVEAVLAFLRVLEIMQHLWGTLLIKAALKPSMFKERDTDSIS